VDLISPVEIGEGAIDAEASTVMPDARSAEDAAAQETRRPAKDPAPGAKALRPGVGHCLWGCTVAPGFDFADFELAQGPERAARHPALADRIARMTR
jgi:hypothetical protein